MNKHTIYFLPWHNSENMLTRTEELYLKSNVFDIIKPGDLVAVKLHVGELGNPNYIKPFFAKQVLDKIVEKGGNPFLTDTSTYYPLKRSNAVDHMQTAITNGFNFGPFIVADGLRSENGVRVDSPDPMLSEVEVAGAIYNADAMIVLSHLKGHPLSGFGGAIKNLGMGCVTKKSKLDQHRLVDLKIEYELCQGCGTCIEACWFNLPRIEEGKVVIDDPQCMRCPLCSTACPEGAIRLEGQERICEGLTVAAKAVTESFAENKIAYITFATDISSVCDCATITGSSIQPNIGIFAGLSPLSIDAASLKHLNYEALNHSYNVDCWAQAQTLANLGEAGSIDPKVITV